MPNSKMITEKEWVRETKCTGFVAAFKFWVELQKLSRLSEDVISDGDGLLRGLALLIYDARKGIAGSPQEMEAFRYCGMEPIRMAKPGEWMAE